MDRPLPPPLSKGSVVWHLQNDAAAVMGESLHNDGQLTVLFHRPIITFRMIIPIYLLENVDTNRR